MGIVLVPLVLPWGYLFRHYVKAPGERWGGGVTTATLRDTARLQAHEPPSRPPFDPPPN